MANTTDQKVDQLLINVNTLYNILSANLNGRISDIQAAVVNTANTTQNRITLAANQQRSDATLIQKNIINAINTPTQAILNQVDVAAQRITKDIQTSLAQTSQAIQKKSDSLGVIIQDKLNSINGELKDKITTILNPILVEIDKNSLIVSKNIDNSILKATIDIKQANTDTNILIRNVSSALNNAINSLSTVTTQLGGISNTSGINLNNVLGNSEPQWLTDILSDIYTKFGQNSGAQNDNFFTGIIRIISGNDAANGWNAINASNITGEISNQLHNIGQIETDLINGRYKTLDDLNIALKNSGIQSTVLGSVIQLLFVIANIGEVVKSFMLPTKIKIEQFGIAAYQLKQLSEPEITSAFIHNLISYEQAIKELDNLGHSKSDSEIILKATYPRFDAQSLLKLAHLGKISPDTLKTKMREIGFNEIDAILNGYLFQPRPGIQDLIQFAVKEVYSPETSSKFGQYLEFPKEFADRAKLEGLDETYAKQYWAAHWQLPGATMGYDMLHRGIITTEDLKALLKALDVMPFWRDKLIQLSYNVVGRIDTRRLYAYGIWDKHRVYQEYLHEGYSPKDAEDLTKFTIQYDDEQDSKHKTKLQTQAHNIYIKAYNNKLLSKQQTKDKIVALGYKANEVDLELDLEDYEQYVTSHQLKQANHRQKIVSLSLDAYKRKSLSRGDLLATLSQNGYNQAEAIAEADFSDKEVEIAFRASVVKEIQQLYFEGLYDDNAVLTKLMALGFANSEALNIIDQLRILKSLDDKKPTPMQFEKMYKNGIINKSEYAQILDDLGYNQKYINQIIALGEL